jgi:hypothetical protein
LRQDRAAWNHEPDTPPAVQEVFLFVEGNEAATIDEGDVVGVRAGLKIDHIAPRKRRDVAA